MVKAAKCSGCGRVYAPPRPLCADCSAKTEPIEVGDTGELLTYTILHTVPEGFTAPLYLGMVELDDISGSKLICECMGEQEEQELEIGKRVKIQEQDGKYYFRAVSP